MEIDKFDNTFLVGVGIAGHEKIPTITGSIVNYNDTTLFIKTGTTDSEGKVITRILSLFWGEIVSLELLKFPGPPYSYFFYALEEIFNTAGIEVKSPEAQVKILMCIRALGDIYIAENSRNSNFEN